MKTIKLVLVSCLLAFASVAAAQDARPYSEGRVVAVTSVKVMDGQFENYMHFLDTNYKAAMDAAKEAGLVSDWGVYSASPRSPDDADLYLTVGYPNMAALDGLDEKMEPVMAKVTRMTIAQREEASGKRTVMRTILGTELIRELNLK